jgi:hypothetical protein
VVNHKQREPFVIQILGAINEVNAGFRNKPSNPSRIAPEDHSI